MHYAAVSLVGLQVSNESTLLLSLAVDRLRTVLAVKGSLRRAEDGAPLTAPGRSEEPYLIRRERRIGKSMTLTAQHLATFNRRDHVRATKPRGTCTAAGGWMPKISRRPARGRDFSLDIPFYRTRRLLARILSEEPIDSPLRIFSGTLVNGGAIFTDISGAVRRDVATAWRGTSPLNCAGWLAATFVKGELSLSPHRGATLVNGLGFRCSCRFVGLRSSDATGCRILA